MFHIFSIFIVQIISSKIENFEVYQKIYSKNVHLWTPFSYYLLQHLLWRKKKLICFFLTFRTFFNQRTANPKFHQEIDSYSIYFSSEIHASLVTWIRMTVKSFCPSTDTYEFPGSYPTSRFPCEPTRTTEWGAS